ncbi:MAG: hypothetical protein K1X86_15665 [Ignavibacteria bacterium]|nr:hypothetical protein [Ignavibacteria bacterium]
MIRISDNLFFVLCLISICAISSCGEKPPERKQFSTELKSGAPASEFTIKFEGTPGTTMQGYITPAGKESLDSIIVDGPAGAEVRTMKANKVFCYFVKKGEGGNIRVSIFSGNKLMIRDSTGADNGFIQLTALPDSAGINREYVKDSIAFFLSITSDEKMSLPIKLRKSMMKNFATSMHRLNIPVVIPITDCQKFEADVFNDENFMAEFTCEIWNSKKEPIARKTCPEGGPGVGVHLYDDEYFRKKKIQYDTVEAKK